MLDRFLAQYYERNPVTATFTGVRTHDTQLPALGRAARDAERRELEAMRQALTDAHPLPRAERPGAADAATARDAAGPIDWAALARDPVLLDAELARSYADVRILEIESRHFHDRNPALWTGEAIFGVLSLMLRPGTDAAALTDALLARSRGARDLLGMMLDECTAPIPAPWLARVRREAAAAGVFFQGRARHWAAASQLPETVARAFGELGACLAAADAALGDRFDAGTEGCAIGAEAYGVLLARGHHCDEGADALLARALEELPREQARLDRLVREVAGSPDELARRIAADHPTAAGYLDAFHARWTASRDFARARDLVHWPDDWPIRYTPIPEWAREVAPALYFLFYRSPGPFEPYTEHPYLVAPLDLTAPAHEQERVLAAWNHSTITLNHVVHHGGLGHHVQNWHATHRSRSRLGQVAAVDGACRIGMFLGGSFAEGWACYATELMDELGFLTPLERAAEQQSRVRMLARAIVDIRLHTGRIDFDTAVATYRTLVGMPDAAALGEATKNAMFPGTAVMYWLGTQGLLGLRETLRARQGDAFSLRAFHNAVLGWGAIPVPVLSRLLLATLP